MGKYTEYEGKPEAAGMRVAIVAGRFNDDITKLLLEGARAELAEQLVESGELDAVICLGAVIRGDTPHFDFVAGECASGISRVALDTGVPIAFGVLTTDELDQALARAGGTEGNKGAEAAATAVEMVDLLRQLG